MKKRVWFALSIGVIFLAGCMSTAPSSAVDKSPKTTVVYSCTTGNGSTWEVETFAIWADAATGSCGYSRDRYEDGGKTHITAGMGNGSFTITGDTITFKITAWGTKETASYTGKLANTGMTLNGKTYTKEVVTL